MIDCEKFNRLITAFSTNIAGSCRTCECGKTYYNSDGGWDWDDGELEALESDFPENDRDYAIGTVVIGGQHYANACNCWEQTAKKMMEWIDAHDFQIALYLNEERKHALMVAKNMPQVTDL